MRLAARHKAKEAELATTAEGRMPCREAVPHPRLLGHRRSLHRWQHRRGLGGRRRGLGLQGRLHRGPSLKFARPVGCLSPTCCEARPRGRRPAVEPKFRRAVLEAPSLAVCSDGCSHAALRCSSAADHSSPRDPRDSDPRGRAPRRPCRLATCLRRIAAVASAPRSE